MNFVLDIVVGTVLWVAIILVPYATIQYIRHKKFGGIHYQRVFVAAFVIAILPAINNYANSSSQFEPPTPEQVQQLKDIKQAIFSEVTESEHAKFWNLMSERGASDRQAGEAIDELCGATNYQQVRMFWSDALQAVNSGLPHKSAERRAFEEQYLAPEHIQRNDQNIQRIAAGESVTIQGQEVVITAEIAGEMVANMEATLSIASSNCDLLRNQEAFSR